jgi:hypothetical protein
MSRLWHLIAASLFLPLVGAALANAVTAGTALAPVVACFTRGPVQRTIDGDFIMLEMDT